MTNKYGATLCIPNLTRHVFVHSAVLSDPAVLLRKLRIALATTTTTEARTSSQNMNYCSHVATIVTSFILQECDRT